MSNVIPLFGRNHPSRHEVTRTDASTHFMLAAHVDGQTHPVWLGDTLTTLCGREADGFLDKDTAFPECAACKAEWSRLTGWAFPLPSVVCTD
jgi:hypothetical protein